MFDVEFECPPWNLREAFLARERRRVSAKDLSEQEKIEAIEALLAQVAEREDRIARLDERVSDLELSRDFARL